MELTKHHGVSAALTPYAIRRLWPHERDAYVAHLQRLDHGSRIDRFGIQMDDAALQRYADKSFCVGGLVKAYVEHGEIRAAGELQGLMEFPRQGAEAAFSVETAWRRSGIGGALFDAIVLAARNRGQSSLEIICHPGNTAMLALARRHGMDCLFEDGEVHGRARLDLRSPSSLMREAMGDAAGAVSAMLDAGKSLRPH
ncbi:MAG: GNAT family N-acetyltransferase [Bosea sp. (in: a-proteobacteria)]